jgi:hypothetical protein
LEVGAEGGFKLDLRQDCDPGRQDRDPGKQKLKGAVRTETYQRHYCQHFIYTLTPPPHNTYFSRSLLNQSLDMVFYSTVPFWDAVVG